MLKKKNQFHGIGAKTTCGFNKQRIDWKHHVSSGVIQYSQEWWRWLPQCKDKIKQIAVVSWYIMCPHIVQPWCFIYLIWTPPSLFAGSYCENILWQADVINELCYSRASSLLKPAVMSQLCWIWIMDPVRPSLTPRERWRHAAAAASPRRNEMLMHSWLCHRSAAHFLSIVCARVCFYLHTSMFLFAWVCLSANAHSCLSARANVGVSLFILTSVCVLVVCVCVILLREIISSNVHWPDSLPVLGFFRCINILEESPGETESLCKHNHRGSVRELLARASLSGTEEFAAHGVFSSHTYIQIDF